MWTPGWARGADVARLVPAARSPPRSAPSTATPWSRLPLPRRAEAAARETRPSPTMPKEPPSSTRKSRHRTPSSDPFGCHASRHGCTHWLCSTFRHPEQVANGRRPRLNARHTTEHQQARAPIDCTRDMCSRTTPARSCRRRADNRTASPLPCLSDSHRAGAHRCSHAAAQLPEPSGTDTAESSCHHHLVVINYVGNLKRRSTTVELRSNDPP